MSKGKRITSLISAGIFFAQLFISSGIICFNEQNIYAAPFDGYSQKVSDKINNKGQDNSKNILKEKKKRFIVKYKENVSLNKINEVEQSVSKKLKINKVKGKKKNNLDKIKVYELDTTDDIKNSVKELNKNENIDYIQEDYELDVFDYPSDHEFSNQWYLQNIGQEVDGSVGIPGIDINVINAWKKTKGSKDIVVGVIDTGVDIYHEDLKNNIYINSGEIPGNGIDDDSNNYIDDYQGWDFANDDNTVFDSSIDDKHGTHVSGIIAATENEIGICGVAPGIKVLPVKFINGSSGYTSDVIEAIQYCKNMNVDIVNCSWGCSEDNYALKEAMEESGLTFICASGNNGLNTSDTKIYPACFELPNIISVAAIDNKGNLANFSNYGNDIDIAAPGVRILSTLPNNSYGILSGTSMAAPLVTAALSLLKSYDNNISQSEMISRIKNCVSFSDNLSGMVASGGSLNVDAVINNTFSNYIDNIEPTPTPTTMYTIIPANTPAGEKYIDEILIEPKDNSLEGNNKQIKPIPENITLDTVCSSIYAQSSLPDAYEANDSKDTATSITQGININANINIDTDEDWYCVNATTKGKITVTLDNIPENCDYDIAIYDKSGAFVTSSSTSGNTPEKADAIISEAGEYYIRVYSWGGSNPTTNYILKAVISKPDGYEVNDYIHQYKEIQLRDRVTATIDNLKDEDWFKINISQGGDYVFALQNIPIGTDYDLYVYNLTGDNISKSTLGANSSEVINLSLTPGDYYISIRSFSGYSDAKDYEFAVNEKKTFSMEFDKKFANVGEIVTATIKVDNIDSIAGFQANIVFDPKVLQVVNPDTGDIYTSNTLPTEGNILVNSDYQNFYLASHDLKKGILNFGKVYQNLEEYRVSGNSEATGTIAKIGFRVLGDYATNVRFEKLVYKNEGLEDSVVEDVTVFDWNGDKIPDSEYLVVQPITINPYSAVIINSSSVTQFDISKPLSSGEIKVASAGSTKICGYIEPDFIDNSKLLSNFKVQVLGTGNSSIYDYTDSSGYFEINNAPDDCSYTLQISKSGYLYRTIKVPVNGYQIGTLASPIKMWAGDLAQDNAINMEDILEACKSFNTAKGSAKYSAARDLNSDGGVNLEDVMIIAKNFNRAPTYYNFYSPVAVAEKYDWYYFTMTDENGVTARIYLSDIGESTSTENVTIVANRSDEALWCEYTLSGSVLSRPKASYAFDPIKSGDVTVASIGTTAFIFNVKDVQVQIEKIKNKLLDLLYEKTGVYPVLNEDIKMVATGIVFGIDDNMFFGAAHKILRREPYDDNYYFMRAKTFTDAVFTAAYTTAGVASAVEAARALQTAGASGALALATSPTGVGGVTFGGVAVAQLAEAAAMAGVAVVSGCLAGRSQGILKADADRLSSIMNNMKKKLDNLTPNELKNLSIDELNKLLPDGWEFNANGPNGNDFVHIKDPKGNYRIRIDPPDKVTTYRHMHVYDATGNSLDINGNIVPYDNPAAHIPYNK